ncbi:MAG: gamma carbonic anhydrase family protein [Verrucomicrobia bacterium]|nr:gamma carbonic anhydrase family protein [Verrucomicrobiota bacterium]
MTIEDRLAKFLGRTPRVSESAFVANSATLVGDVRLGKDSSVFYGAVLRGDIETITIGESSNVQDGCIVHLADDLGAHVGAWCTIGHAAIIHACTIGDECLVGMQAVVLDGAEIGDQCLIGAGSLVTQRTKIPPRSLVLGSPAKVVRPLKENELASLRESAAKYVAVARAHAARQAAA